ncbi:MAG: carbohydrate-binding family 9-like protein [Candidatus Poribacteria bacterium]|nr:carbohydrate-binding family 9-like protein [Candidatus Poribacteria bacterium]
MKRGWIGLAGWCALSVALTGLARAQPLPSPPLRIVVPKLKSAEPPKIDGALDDAAWSESERVMLNDAATGETPKRATKFAILWDDDNLYVAFECDDDSPNATFTQKDANLWEEEVVELFIDPDGDLKSYIELEINPLNTLFDALVLNRTKRWLLRDFEMRDMEHVVAKNDKGWTVEIRMDLEDFAEAPNLPVQVGDTWRANFYRIDRSPYDSSDPKKPEMTSWSPVWVYNFHRVETFGYMQFGE